MKNHKLRKFLSIYILFAFFGITFFTFVTKPCQAQTQSNTTTYNPVIQQADAALAAKDYATALQLYEKARQIKPELKYAPGKIAEINELLDAQPNLKSQLFEDIIVKAETYFNKKDYPQAKTEYQKAIGIDPSAQFPKDRLAQISALYVDPTDAAYFTEAISNGDKALAANDFDKSVMFYETALSVKPNTKSVKDKIANARKQQADFKLKGEQAVKLLAGADKLLAAGKRTEALAEYQKVLTITPDNQHAKDKIQEINKFTNDKKSLQETYDKAIEIADQFYINRDFVNARLKYQEALKAKPEARYPKEMLDKTKSGESQLLSEQERYDAALVSAESLLKSSDYDAALIGFKSASAIKPSETYPKTKISEIEKLIGERNSRKDAYDIAIKNGDQAFEAKKYDAALSHFRNALSLLPNEKYPAEKIEAITALNAQQKTLDDTYKKFIADGDALFKQNKFAESIGEYTKASELKPEETYPQQKITDAQNQLAALKSKDENYNAAITSADTYFADQKFDEALGSYSQALKFKPTEKYPKDKTDEINKILAKQKADANNYAQFITNGDKAFAAGNYPLALSSFQDALNIKPTEQYPQEKIAETKTAIAEQQKTNEKYTLAITSADKSLAAKEYDLALTAYTEASGLKSSEKYPQDQIVKINKLLSELRSADESYSQAVTEGDKNFADLKYAEAIASYNRANTYKPTETYPKNQVEKINGLVAEQKKLEADYQIAIGSADKLLASKKYDEAIADYRKALVLKPSEKYPTDKISESEKLIADLKNLQESYDKAVAEGDKLQSDKDFTNSLASFKSAALLKPAETYPKKKIAEVQAILDKDKAEGQRYDEAIAQADKLFTGLKYVESLEAYKQVSGIKPNEKYPQEQIAKVNQLIAEQKKLDEDYQKAITEAELEFKSAKYNEAKVLYSNASALKPSENLPKAKIVEIDGILAELQNKEQSFTGYISAADALFAEKKYSEAILSYNNALKIKPTETYPKTQVEKINGLIAEQKKLEADYQTAIGSADKLLASKKFDEAIVDYRKALVLKPSEKYPVDKIAELEKLIADLKNLQESYDKAVAEGDKFLSDKDFANSLAAFKSAALLKPSETYPKQKIAEVQAILDKDKAEGQRYDEAIAQADKLFTGLKYSESLEAYKLASGIKPSEKYPQEQIAKVNQLIAEQKKLDEDYQKAITEADLEFKSAKYNEAKVLYSNASTLKPSENLPKAKIVEIDGILAELQNKEQSFTSNVSAADALFAEKKYSEAILSYNNALKIKPTETYPKTQVEKINGLIAEQKKLEADYQTAIVSADKLFISKKYDEAIADYRKALVLKPSEKYPTDKIAESEKLIYDLKALEDAYNKAVAEGDKLQSDKEFANSLAAFKSAALLKPAETYPKQKIAEVQAILDKDKAEGQRYDEAIAQADKLFTGLKYSESLEAYKLASGIKPSEKYPQEQIAKVNQLLAEQKKLDEDYQKAITEADLEFKNAKYSEAKVLYSNASVLKPNENLPKAKIVEIDGILAGLLKKDQDYSKAIGDGDILLGEKKYAEATTSYTAASSIKPTETYPKTQIGKIENLLKEQKILDDSYLNLITAADQLFTAQKFADAIAEYRKAATLKPSEKYPTEKIAETEKEIATIKEKQLAYDKAVAEGDKKLLAKEYENALLAYKNANLAKPNEQYPTTKIAELEVIIAKQNADNSNYADAIALADNFFKEQKYREALEPYQRATTIKPSEKYPQDQIVAVNKFLAEQKKTDEEYQKFITDAEAQFKSVNYNEAKSLYTSALALKPSEKLPKDKIAEIEGILAEIKQKDENYTKALNTAAELYAAKNPDAAIKSYEEATLLKPAEKFPQERIAAIKAELKAIDDNYNKAIALGDSKLASKNLMDALNAYQNALEIKPSETFPKSKIAEINTMLLAQKEEMEKMYTSYIADGDALFNGKDYPGAKSAFTKAAGIKPDESYPKQRLTELNKIVEEIELARKVEYSKALGEADKLYNTKIFDQAIDAYEVAAKINPSDTYPGIQINKIRKYISDHAIQDLYSQSFEITEGNEKKFTFSSIEPRLRKNNYILLKARSSGKVAPKVYLNYGKDSQKNGGIVLRSLDKSAISDYMIRISVQDKWYREDNNWISIYVETGDIEITKVQIAAGDE